MAHTLDSFSTPALDVVIMAAGKGTRMKSKLPKVLHRLAGRALLQHVVDTAAALSARQVTVITGHGATEVEATLIDSTRATGQFVINFVRQEPQLGTGHAVQQAVPHLHDDGMVLVLSGDVPLTQVDTLQQLIAASGGTKLALLTIAFDDPTGYGRILRSGEAVQAIVEQKDATPAQRQITEVYSGIMAAPAAQLKAWLARLDNKNAQGEFYLTDVVKFAVADGVPVVAHKIFDAVQVAGVNSPVQLAELERAYQQRLAVQLMEQGVRLADQQSCAGRSRPGGPDGRSFRSAPPRTVDSVGHRAALGRRRSRRSAQPERAWLAVGSRPGQRNSKWHLG